jgi:hypothetical protein
MYGAEATIDGGDPERKPIAATLASYSFNSIATSSFLQRVQKHLLSCVEILRATIHPALLEYLSEANISEEYSRVSDQVGHRFETPTLHFGPNQAGTLGNLDEFKSQMVQKPSGNVHREEYSYRLTSHTVVLPHTEFGSGDKTISVFVEKAGPRREVKTPATGWLSVLRAKVRGFFDWWKEPFF